MRSYETDEGDITYRVDVSYGDFARSLFETEDDPQVYDKKLDHLESAVQELGEALTDEFFDRYQEAREEVEADLPDFAANIGSGEADRTGKMTYLTFEGDDLDDVEAEVFLDTVEDALTDTLAGTVATWYDATRQASQYRDEDFTVQVDRIADDIDTYFQLDTDPAADGDVLERSVDRIHTDPGW
jgi:hypothetical protein